MPVRVVSSRSTLPLTVNALLEMPLVVPERILTEFQNQFVMDQVLRNAGSATGGAARFRVSSGIFADNAAEIVAEGAEIPLAMITHGDISSAPVKKRALGVAITREMRLRNNIGEVERQIQMVRNTVVRDIDGAFFTSLSGAITQTRAATAAWSSGSATIRKDINAARLLIRIATAPQGSANSYMGFEADTLLIHPNTEADLINSSEFTNLLFGTNIPSNIGSLSDVGNVLGLKPMVSVSVTPGTAWIVASKQIGGYADEIPLEATALYEYTPNQLWRSDVTRSTVGFIDQPLAGSKITGV